MWFFYHFSEATISSTVLDFFWSNICNTPIFHQFPNWLLLVGLINLTTSGFWLGVFLDNFGSELINILQINLCLILNVIWTM